MENKNSSYSVQIGKTTFIVCVKQSETAKKPIEKVFKDICRHEVQEDFFSAGLLSLEKIKEIILTNSFPREPATAQKHALLVFSICRNLWQCSRNALTFKQQIC